MQISKAEKGSRFHRIETLKEVQSLLTLRLFKFICPYCWTQSTLQVFATRLWSDYSCIRTIFSRTPADILLITQVCLEKLIIYSNLILYWKLERYLLDLEGPFTTEKMQGAWTSVLWLSFSLILALNHWSRHSRQQDNPQWRRACFEDFLVFSVKQIGQDLPFPFDGITVNTIWMQF